MILYNCRYLQLNVEIVRLQIDVVVHGPKFIDSEKKDT